MKTFQNFNILKNYYEMIYFMKSIWLLSYGNSLYIFKHISEENDFIMKESHLLPKYVWNWYDWISN